MNRSSEITFVRLTEIHLREILSHMIEPRVAEHMPLLNFEWTLDEVERFVMAKEDAWARDGLGHWAILSEKTYIGWGGFQKEGDEWDFGLVLKPQYFGLGMAVSRKAIEFARGDPRIDFVTFLLPPSRKKFGALIKGGAKFVGTVEHQSTSFLKYRLETK